MKPGRVVLVAIGALAFGYASFSLTRRWYSEDGADVHFPPAEFLPKPLTSATEKPERDEACRTTYTRLHAKPRIEVRVVLGYKDARPARFVGDRYERAVLVDYLTAKCPSGFHACGFRRDEDDADRFAKTIPGIDGQPREVVLKLVHSAAGPDDDANREDSFQAYQSAVAQTAFLSAIREADVVLYEGHSRDGGGPDFFPPRLRADGHVNYYGYQQSRSGLDELVRALRARATPLPLLGLFSCASSQHFVDTVQKEKAGTGVIASPRLLYYADALKDLLATLSLVLASACADEMDAGFEKSERTGFFLGKEE